MKKRSIFLSFVFALFGIFSVFTFAGCDVSIKDLSSTLAEVQKVYSSNENVFHSGSILNGSISSDYVVDYEEVVNYYVSSPDSTYKDFRELETKYNSMLAVSQRFIDENASFILNYEQHSKFTGQARSAINKFNDSLKKFVEASKSFLDARRSFVSYFQDKGVSAIQELEKSKLLIFKKSYGKIVSASVNAASDLSKCLDETILFDLLKSTATSKEDFGLVKSYVEIKMLDAFNKVLLEKIHSQITWTIYQDKEDSVVDFYDDLNDCFNNYFIGDIVCANTNYKTSASDGEMKNLISKINNYVSEIESFEKAVEKFDFKEWATEKNANFENYAKTNEFAYIQLGKMNQFVNVTTPAFVYDFIGSIH